MVTGSQATKVECDVYSDYVHHERDDSDHAYSDDFVVLFDVEHGFMIMNAPGEHNRIISSAPEHNGVVINVTGWHVELTIGIQVGHDDIVQIVPKTEA